MIRAGTIDDLPALETLWGALHAHHAALASEVAPVRELSASWSRRLARYEEWLGGDDAELLVAEEEDVLVGYAMLRVVAGPASWDIGDRTAELETLSVLPSARGSGVGAQLVEAARERAIARGAKAFLVAVAHANEGAIRFYEREGFKPFYELLWQPLG